MRSTLDRVAEGRIVASKKWFVGLVEEIKMTEMFDFQKFLEYVSNNNWRQALDYKNQCIPDRLYHYFPLHNRSSRLDYRKENEKYYTSLENGKIRVSSFEALNDPFEFNGLFFDPQSNAMLRNNAKYAENVLKRLKNCFPVFCLSDNFDKNMPLWAHYSNNHKGYCVEYSTIDKSTIFPVVYVPKREPASNIITTMLTELDKGFRRGTKPSGKFWKNFIPFFTSFTCKHELWRYEGEYRLLWMDNYSFPGQLVGLDDAKLKIEKIFMGLYCDDKKRLRKIGKILGCEVYEMILESTNCEFSLKSSRVL